MTTSIEQVSQKYRGLRFNSIAEQLPVLLSQAGESYRLKAKQGK